MKTILLIEDDIAIRENTAELLELANYNVITAPNGKLGLDYAKNLLPDIIVCDIMMPELDGYSVLKALGEGEQTKFIPFLFLSAKTERQDIRKGMSLGADDYITKPFSEEELISAIESRIARSQIFKEQNNTNVAKNADNLINDLNDLKNYFYDNGQTFIFNNRDVIYSKGDHSNYIYLIIKGAVKTHSFDIDGKELITALYNADMLFGYTSFTENIPYQDYATALSQTELAGITKTELNTILEDNPNLTLNLIELLTEDLKSVKEQLLQMAYGSVGKKTAKTLLKFSEKLNVSPNAPIKISRNDLASVAGIATETLIRSLSNLKKEGIIEIEGRNIKIIDLEKLQNVY
ncbi:response regulator [Mangrovimonas aestuarii]|uniref:response regulator n=1 Tax=Mangrovimonas aestuarii TaxID=3018443 RepID=UPI0023791F25|nr:response regulator [Mangrovimonas aestuarii]